MVRRNAPCFTGPALWVGVLILGLAGAAAAVSVVDCDLIEDCHIDWQDLELMAARWLVDCSVYDCNGADLDDTDWVDFGDFGLFAEHWLTDPNTVCLWKFIEQQLADTTVEVGVGNYPYHTQPAGNWETRSAGHWTSGFFPGCLWYMYERTDGQAWRTWAEDWTGPLESEKYKTSTHDMGFIFFCSFGNGYRLTGDTDYKDVVLTAADSLSTRYNSTVGCIKSWDNPAYTFPVIIDNMMNLEILFWGSKNGGDAAWYDMAVSHATKTMQEHVRPDGSTYQIVDYDPATGAVLDKLTKQGYSDESTWSRGQGWGLYGFTMAYRETSDPNFLETAKDIADYFVDNLPPDYVPYWDFDDPAIPNTEKDSSSAAIAASGLLELATFVTGPDEIKYRDAALDIIASLSSPAYLAEGTSSSGILLHGVQNYNSKKAVNATLIYSDYYFIEALLRKEQLVP